MKTERERLLEILDTLDTIVSIWDDPDEKACLREAAAILRSPEKKASKDEGTLKLAALARLALSIPQGKGIERLAGNRWAVLAERGRTWDGKLHTTLEQALRAARNNKGRK